MQVLRSPQLHSWHNSRVPGIAVASPAQQWLRPWHNSCIPGATVGPWHNSCTPGTTVVSPAQQRPQHNSVPSTTAFPAAEQPAQSLFVKSLHKHLHLVFERPVSLFSALWLLLLVHASGAAVCLAAQGCLVIVQRCRSCHLP